MWLQGYYFYEALLRASPAFLDLRKPNTKPFAYLDEPVSLGITKENNQPDEKKVELERAKAYVFFTNWANANKNK